MNMMHCPNIIAFKSGNNKTNTYRLGEFSTGIVFRFLSLIMHLHVKLIKNGQVFYNWASNLGTFFKFIARLKLHIDVFNRYHRREHNCIYSILWAHLSNYKVFSYHFLATSLIFLFKLTTIFLVNDFTLVQTDIGTLVIVWVAIYYLPLCDVTGFIVIPILQS